MGTESESRAVIARIRSAIPPVLVLASAIGYLGIDYNEQLSEPVSGSVPPLVNSLVIALQALALVFRRRTPVAVLAAVTALDAILLATSGGELGTGALAVIIAAYAVVRRGSGPRRYGVLAAAATLTVVAGSVGMDVAGTYPPLWIIGAGVVRLLVQYGIPAAVAEFLLGRERLVDALRDRAEFAEREQATIREREMVDVRTAMARELHDIAAHHLSGIIVGSQAAAALAPTDPARAQEMLSIVQRDARTTLADLRRTVGLLRSDASGERGSAGQDVQVPTLARVAGLVDVARERGQQVDYVTTGEPRALGPLAETAGYRMVQESLANAARHASGATCLVRIEYRDTEVEVVVENDAHAAGAGAARPTAHPTAGAPDFRRGDRGFGIPGMEERADLVGARLTTGPLPQGGWRNQLTIPFERNRAT